TPEPVMPFPCRVGRWAALLAFVPSVALGAEDRLAAARAAALGDSLYFAGAYAAAIAPYREAVGLDPEDGDSFYGLAACHHFLGNYAAAATAHREAARFRENRASALYNLACAEALLGNADESLRALEEALDAGFSDSGNLLVDSDLAPVREDPRFERMIRRLLGPGYTGFDRADPTAEEMRRGIRILVKTIRDRHPNPYRHVSPEDWEGRAAAAIAVADTLSPAAYYVELRELAGLAGDVHTSVFPRRGSPVLRHSLPLRVWQFADGLHVRAAAPDHADLVGARVLEIGGVPVAVAWSRVMERMSAENEFMSTYMAQVHLEFPAYLRALGLADSDATATWSFELPNGSRRVVEMAAADSSGYLGVLGTSIGFDAPEGWIQVHERLAEPPRWLARKNENYWMERIDGTDAAYLQFNIPRRSGQPWRDFLAESFRLIRERDDVRRLVIDLRHNEGGWAYMAHELVHAIVSTPKVNRPGHLYVLTSRVTQSAGVTIAAKLDVETHALFVGEGSGAHPNFYNGPMGNHPTLALPGTDLVFRVSTVLEQNSDPLDHRCFIAPDIPIAMTAADHAAGRDPVLEAALGADPEAAGLLLANSGGRPGPVYFQWRRPTQDGAFRGDWHGDVPTAVRAVAGE
ncbi:MAG TPA: hypothetical protein VKU85_08910, partial [bacterium]|nr:hypothetical protein [bacterium]